MRAHRSNVRLSVVGLLAAGALSVARGSAVPSRADFMAPAGIQAMGTSVLTIANLDPAQPATSIVDFRRQPDGAATQQVVPPIAPLEALDLDISCDVPVSTGVYATAATADRAIALQAVTTWRTSGASAAYEESEPGEDILVPLIMKNARQRSSLVTIQNTEPTRRMTATVDFYASGVITPVHSIAVDLPPRSSRTLDLLKDSDFFPERLLPSGFRGWLHASAEAPLAVQVFLDVANQPLPVWAFEGLPVERASDRLFVPRFARASTGGTTLALLNHHRQPVAVSLSFLGWEGVCVSAGETITHTLAPAEVLLLGDGPDEVASPLPQDCTASLVVEADAPLSGVVIERDQVTPTPGMVLATEAAYLASGAEDAARRFLVPTFRRAVEITGGLMSGGPEAGSVSQPLSLGPRSSSLFAMNIGPTTATATLELFDAAGQPITGCGDACVAEIGPYATHPWLASELDAMPDDTDGRALITSDLDLVVAVAESGGVADLTMLRGMAVPETPPERAAQLPLESSFVPLLFATGCTRPTPTATPGEPVTPTATEPVEPSPTPTLGPSPTPECTRHTTEMSLSASATEIGVGELVTVTARLQNVGCGMVGLLLYRLEREPGLALQAASPLTVSHPIGLGTGQADEAQFVLRGVRGGLENVSVSVSFEVHLGYPGPAYWASQAAGPIAVRVRELRNYLPLAIRYHELSGGRP